MNNLSSRYSRLREFMVANNCTWEQVGKLIGTSRAGACVSMQKEETKGEYIEKMIERGFPAELLPKPKKKSLLM